MTVRDVWASIDGQPAVAVSHDGDYWYFPIPQDRTGHIVVQIWADDYAGNQSYRAAILFLEEGTVKSIRWLDTGGECVMLRIVRPTVESWERPECVMLPHECRRSGYATVL